MNLRGAALACVFAITLTGWRPAAAATFTPYRMHDNEVGIWVRGRIERGDAYKFMTMVNFVARIGGRVVFVDLNTPGGNATAGLDIANLIHASGYDTMVYPGSTCASACSLIFFAGRRKILGAGARIGVHRAAYRDGAEFMATLGTSFQMAAKLRAFGASEAVIARSLATPPGRIAWLPTSDLLGTRGLLLLSATAGPSPLMPNAFKQGWSFGNANRDERVCPKDSSVFANGCRAGAAAR